MLTLGIIEESLDNRAILQELKPYLRNRRIEQKPQGPVPLWHVNEYALPKAVVFTTLLPLLERHLLPSWYIHAFDDTALTVVLRGRSFTVSPQRDASWDAMIDYGVSVGVGRTFLEHIPLRV